MKRFIRCLSLGFALSVVFAGGCASPMPTGGQPTTMPAVSASATPQPVASASPAAASGTAQATAASPTESTSQVKKPQVIHLSYDSKAISNNVIDDKITQDIFVILPLSYDEEKNYPVVYFVPGFNEGAASFAGRAVGEISNGADAEFIIVVINGANKYGGSFMTNSPVSGNWEDFAVKEVVSLIDSKYKTIPSAKGRGITGFSMGGFVAINLALRHPDVYSAAYALSPGLFDNNDLADAMKTWAGDNYFLTAYGQAFCPMPDKSDSNYTETPKLDGSAKDVAIAEKWEAGYGGLQEKIDAYLALKTPLKAIALEYGTSDVYGWIPKGCEFFSSLLKQNGIENTVTTFKGGHNIPSKFVAESLAPFFKKVFAD